MGAEVGGDEDAKGGEGEEDVAVMECDGTPPRVVFDWRFEFERDSDAEPGCGGEGGDDGDDGDGEKDVPDDVKERDETRGRGPEGIYRLPIVPPPPPPLALLPIIISSAVVPLRERPCPPGLLLP